MYPWACTSTGLLLVKTARGQHADVRFCERVMAGLLSAATPVMCWYGFRDALLAHVFIVELVYYWGHRIMHHKWVYRFLHKHHHLSIV